MTSNAGSSRSKTALPISNKVILPAIGKANNKPTTSPGSNAGGAKVGSWAAGDESSAGITAYGGGGDRQQEEGGRDDDEEVRVIMLGVTLQMQMVLSQKQNQFTRIIK